MIRTLPKARQIREPLAHYPKARTCRCSTESSKKACGSCRPRHIHSGSTQSPCSLVHLNYRAGRESSLRQSLRTTCPICTHSPKSSSPIVGIRCGRVLTHTIRSAPGRGCVLEHPWRLPLSGLHCNEFLLHFDCLPYRE